MLSENKYYKLDEMLLSNQRKYSHCLDVACECGYHFVSEAILDSYYNKKENGLRIALKLDTSHPVWVYDFLKASGYIPRPKGRFLKNILSQDSFEEIDSKIMFYYYEEKKAIAIKNGYQYVSEALTDMYYNKQESRGFIARTFKMTGTNIHYNLRRINMVGNKINSDMYDFFKLTIKERTSIAEKMSIKYGWIPIRDFLYNNKIDPSPRAIRHLKSIQQKVKSWQ